MPIIDSNCVLNEKSKRQYFIIDLVTVLCSPPFYDPAQNEALFLNFKIRSFISAQPIFLLWFYLSYWSCSKSELGFTSKMSWIYITMVVGVRDLPQKHRKNCKTVPREHLIGCQGVNMFLLKDPLKKKIFFINKDLS